MPTSDFADSYDEEELLRRLRAFDSDSTYLNGLIAAAVKRIEDLERHIEAADGDMREAGYF